jgi:hypothetical protein
MSATDHFPTTQQTWILDRLAEGHGGSSALRSHLMEWYRGPLVAYARGSSLRTVAEPDEHVHGFFVSFLERPGALERWAESGTRLRRWMMNGLLLHARGLRRDNRAHRSRGAALAAASLATFAFLLHGGLPGGSLPHGIDASPEESPREHRSFEASREVEDMRARTMIGLTTLGLAVSPAIAVDRLVPSKQYPTIQSAVDVALDGDRIVLATGVFVESCIVPGKQLAFVGSGANSTTWVAPPGQRCLWMPFLDSKAIAVSDIHFSGFSMPYNAAAVDIESTGSHQISRCRFSGSGYFALELFGQDSIVEDCEFIGNSGSALSLTVPQGTPSGLQLVRRSVFRDNSQTDGQGAAIDIYNSSVRVESCEFRRNSFPAGNGIAIRVTASSLVVADTRFCESSPSSIIGGWSDGGGNIFTTEPCAPPCPADIVDDGAVNGADLAIVLVSWGTSGAQYPGVDVDGSGLVDGSDLAAVLAAWGPCRQ